MTYRRVAVIINNMKTSSVALRQNDSKAIELIKASYRCFRAERIIKYIMIFLSFGVCLAAIFNRYLPQMAPNVADIDKIQQDASTYLNLISGAIIVAGMPLGFYSSRMHTEGTVLQDRYEAYVFDNGANSSILRPISDTYIDLYAKKAHKSDQKFYNYIYGKEPPGNDAAAQFEYIKKNARSDYNLYVSIQPFFLTIWVGFCILIIIIAVSFNDMFVTTLINIMIPSLSAITTIGNSWYNCRLQMRQLTNLIACIDRIEALPPEQYEQYITDKQKIRLLADGLFNYRSSAFVIPDFLVKFYEKSIEKTKTAAQAKVAKETAAAYDGEIVPPAAVADEGQTAAEKAPSRTSSKVKTVSAAKTGAKSADKSAQTAKKTETRKKTAAATETDKAQPKPRTGKKSAASASTKKSAAKDADKPTAAAAKKTTSK